VTDFLREMVAHVAGHGGRNTICLLPLTEGPHGVSDWDAVAALPGLSVLATDPYWKNFEEPAGPFVGRFAQLLAETAARHGVEAQLWLPSFGLTRADIPDLEAAVASSRAAGIDDLWTWGYEACAHMTKLATPDAPLVWEAVTATMTGASGEAIGRLPTEGERVDLRDLDLRPTAELVRVINAEDRTVADAVSAAADSIAHAINAIVARLEAGGRLVYVGAGSSGRIAAADAAECGPTFSAPPGQVLAVTTEAEAAEDDADAGADDIAAAAVGPRDVVIAVSASGRTPYTLGAIDRAARAGALTIGLACVAESELGRRATHVIEVEVGPEVIAGSTRMKAGTAQKLVLNTISTIAMVRLGKTFGNLMVDVQASNEKLRARARRAVAIATAAPENEVAAAITAADGDAKVAIVSLLAGVDAQTARSRLAAAGGVIRQAVGESVDVVG
jgi:N-acetylmuramic acid 6-phosphate etherase